MTQRLKITVKKIEASQANAFCRHSAEPYPKWLTSDFSANRILLAACIENENVGMAAIQFLNNTRNAHIDWLLINEHSHFQIIGIKLLLAVEDYCYEQGYSSVTSEIQNMKKNHSKYYEVYSHAGYKVLFEIGEKDKALYMQKSISLSDFDFIDLTHALTAKIPHWGLDVGFKYNARFIQSTETAAVKFRIQRLEMSAGIGTHMDAPAHCFEHGLAIDQIPLQSFITICRVINISEKADEHYSLTPEDIADFEDKYGTIPESAFVIIYTGWSQRWQQPEKYRNEKIFPNISVDAAKVLLARNIVGIGIDTLSPDVFGSDFPVHSLILGEGKYIIENVANAEQLDPVGNFIFALPIKIADGTEAPMRLIAMKRKLQAM